MIYKVRFFMDSTYQVVLLTPNGDEFEEESVFQGDLSDCEAYIRLNEQGYM